MTSPAPFDAKNPEHVHNALRELDAQVAALHIAKQEFIDKNAALDQQLRVIQATNDAAAAAASSRSRAPKLPLPEKYDGKRHSFRQFINSVTMQFSVSPERFSSDQIKVSFVASLLRGPALDWISPYLEKKDAMLSSWEEFEKRFKAMFDDPHRAKTAVTKLTQLRQGRRPVVAYAAEFRRIVMDADFDNNAEVFWFRAGLSDAILDELTHTTAETDLDKFIAQCILIDTRLREREVERRRRPMVPSSSRAPVAPSPDAMVLDSTSSNERHGPISPEERKRRIENDLCLYCGRAGHRKTTCPSKKGNGQARQRRS
jgi:hypothetical protein